MGLHIFRAFRLLGLRVWGFGLEVFWGFGCTKGLGSWVFWGLGFRVCPAPKRHTYMVLGVGVMYALGFGV